VKSVIWGFHTDEEALLGGKRHIGILYLARRGESARTRRLVQLAKERSLKIQRVDTRALDRLSGGSTHQGVVATVEARTALDLSDFLGSIEGRPSAVVVVLDGVQDPHNLGAVARNASLCGAAAVIFPRDRSAGLTPVVEKVAAGSLDHVDMVRSGNLAAALRALKEKGFWVIGADPGAGTELPEGDFTGRVALVIGDEHRGLRRLTKEHCDQLIRIPSTGPIESFNMAMAAGLFLFYAYLQQRPQEAGGKPSPGPPEAGK